MASPSIVTTVRHERDHNGRAEEHFLPAGPFAILPLKRDATGHRSSIVWTEEADEAERIVALDDVGFHAELERRFGLHLGEIAAVGPRRAFPLGLHVARAFVAERIALIGDAAHVIHPIAGQGLNMGLKDVAALAETIVDAARLGLDPGSPVTLERYQRWRRFDTMAMGVATDGLNRLFSNRSDALRARARRRARPGRSSAGAQAPVHPRGRRPRRRGAEAAEGRGAVTRRYSSLHAKRSRNMPRLIGTMLFALVAGVLATPLSAEPVEDFYNGKQIRIITGAAAGDGYDLWSRMLARHMGRHIPGRPSIIVQNMPGAGTVVAANHVFNVAAEGRHRHRQLLPQPAVAGAAQPAQHQVRPAPVRLDRQPGIDQPRLCRRQEGEGAARSTICSSTNWWSAASARARCRPMCR